jgi:hypothetical protein
MTPAIPMITGPLRKMRTEPETPVSYRLPVGDSLVDLSERVGETLCLKFEGEILCANCGRKTRKSYSQGHCFPCSQRLAACDLCVLQPSRCHYHMGTCREPGWGDEHCMQKHIVYLANTSGLKVGITRAHQVMTRWIDQGAGQALPVLEVATRRVSGLIEAAMARHVSDRTDWRALLRGTAESLDLPAARDRLISECREDVDRIIDEFGDDAVRQLRQAKTVQIEFPVLDYPEKIRSLNFDRSPEIEGRLRGIKGQYLILDTGVLNVRKFRSYVVSVDA